MTLRESISTRLPQDWHLSNIAFLDPGWQVNLCDGEFIVIATGEDIESALDNAAMKSQNQDNFVGRLFGLGRSQEAEPSASSLLTRLGLSRKSEPVRRRV